MFIESIISEPVKPDDKDGQGHIASDCVIYSDIVDLRKTLDLWLDKGPGYVAQKKSQKVEMLLVLIF